MFIANRRNIKMNKKSISIILIILSVILTLFSIYLMFRDPSIGYTLTDSVTIEFPNQKIIGAPTNGILRTIDEEAGIVIYTINSNSIAIIPIGYTNLRIR